MPFVLVRPDPGVFHEVAAQLERAVLRLSGNEAALQPVAHVFCDRQRHIAPSAVGLQVLDAAREIDVTGRRVVLLPGALRGHRQVFVGNGHVVKGYRNLFVVSFGSSGKLPAHGARE